MLILGAALIIVANLFAVYWFGGMLIPLISGGGPYVPSSPSRVKRMIKLAGITSTDTVMDLGCGDGRLLIAAIEAGAKKAVGCEIHPGLVRLARHKIKKRKMQNDIVIKKESLWKTDTSEADVMLLYQIPYAMEKIGEKLAEEMPKGARIVSNGFVFPDWEPDKQEADVYLYTLK
jgi:protein-L-isoaspartate O-methyltransferase